MARAVHRLSRKHAVVASFGDEHVLSKVLPMTGGFPQAAIEEQRPAHLLIAGRVEPPAHVSLDGPIEGPALGMPEDAADRLLAGVEQVELAAEPAMVAALRLLELKEVLVEILLARKGGAVYAL